ncbi:T9SS type A sorting domain-containing protein [Hymenobacter sp. NBH84]|uniref:T9SS-dependent choice-of-anchor J family protein n=1 Tax=Hymenobacter sp. NBH84 TaxID=2596915 RepID=UPI00162495C6|nr:choice-of-anchor J domain-containing protein [Hymenobacter sp. NBH84]QNE38099.1 T9SS type A sorting domain-containing protein [Hymenobacter sp. NBH84]
MAQSYPDDKVRLRGRHWALAALLALGTTGLHAQNLNYRTYGTQTGVTAYTDLADTGTVISTPDKDDSNSAAQEIGFTFRYNNQDFTQFILNTNGYLKLGGTAPSPALYYEAAQTFAQGGPFKSTNAADVNLLVPFAADLLGPDAAEYRVATTGTAPNRVCTIQWKNVQDKPRQTTTTGTGATTTVAEQYTGFSFQVKLYEINNVIDFVYNTPTAGAGAAAPKVAVVGLKGSGNGFEQILSVAKNTNVAWSGPTFAQGDYGGIPFVFAKTTLPDAGRTYRFRPAAATDASVAAIYTLGKLPISGVGPQTIQGAVRNEGYTTLTNIPVTLTVAGANSFTSSKTVASIAPGATATIAFDSFTPTATGDNTVTVTATAAGDVTTANNTTTVAQQVTADTYSHATPGILNTNSYGGTAAVAYLSRFQATDTRSVQSVNVYTNNAASVGRTVYAVVVNAQGAIIARSPDYQLQTADMGRYNTYTLSTPAIVYGTDFFVGLALTPNATSYFPVGTQAENPTRRLSTYSLAIGAGTAPADLSTSNAGKLMIEAVTAPVTCLPPTNLLVSATTSTGATLSFTAPAGTAPAGYSLVYGPAGFDPATAGTTVTGTASPIALTGLTPATTYQAYVRSTCSNTSASLFSAPVTFTTLCTPPAPLATFPYNENFDGVTAPALPCGFTVLDANTDGFTWTTSTAAARSGANALTYNFNNQSMTTAADDWVFTPALTLQAAQQYLLSFYYRVGNTATPERLEIKVGTAPTVAGMTTTIFTGNNLTATTFTQGTAQPIRVTTDGTYYVGMHVTSAANSFRLSIDDVTLTAGPLAVNQALSQAVAAYPNPTSGLLHIDLRSSKAHQAQATVINSLGQSVLTRTLSTKQPDELDMATLAAGIYTLKLDLDGETAVKRISVQK